MKDPITTDSAFGAPSLRRGPRQPAQLRILSALFFCSGACALIYEHLFHKLLGRTLGTSAAGAAAVLAAYMGGLGVGSLVGGRLAKRALRPWRTYALVELGVAVCALTVPRLLGGVTSLYVALAAGRGGTLLLATRFTIAALVTVAPALLAGMTFPLGARILEGGPETGRRLSALYGWNTLGAAVGVLASTYLLVPLAGTGRTLALAACLNGLLALSAALVDRRQPSQVQDDAPVEATPGDDDRVRLSRFVTMCGAFLSGLIGLGLEVVWFRLLAVVIGASVFAFGLMLFAFLVGNGLGGALSSRGRLGRAGPGALVALQLGTAALVLFTLPLWDQIPTVFVVAGRLEPSFAMGEGVRLLCALALLVPPTLLLGASFPLLFRLGARAHDGVAGGVARVYALDTVGAVQGALGATFVLLPLAGARTALIVLALLAAALGVLYLISTPLDGKLRRRAVLAAAAIPLLALAMPKWNFARLNSGANAYFSEGFRDYDRLLYSAEDTATGLVTVVEKAGTRTLLTNGKFEGNDSFEVKDQYLFSLLPLLFVHHFDEAMNIGVGTGATLRVMNAFPFHHLEAVDLSASVIEAARRFFGKINHDALADPRVEIIVEDGRNRLLSSRRRYDLISIELSSIWLSGTGELYNREFYQLAHDRLSTGGIFQQWLQLHHISRRDLTTVIWTLRSVFPHVTLWISGHQGVLIASEQPLCADAQAIAGWTAGPVGVIAREAGLLSPLSALGHLYLGTEDVDRLAADVAALEEVPEDALISSDERPRLEYSTPRGNMLPHAVADNLLLVKRYAMTRLQPLISDGGEAALREAVQAYAALERGFARLAREHAARAGRFLDGEAHRALKEKLGL